ncbi:hypothetical protein H4S04_001525 [Coemansia sp. S16]|nr:hypothetical protein H4S04_001525 [Coemansia sp. S16]
MRYELLFAALTALFSLVAAADTSSGVSTALPSPSPANNVVPFDNLAQNLPEAFSALEDQFSDLEFRSMLTSQLNNPHAVEMFQSLIHDPSAVNSISSLLGDPKIQSSLSIQFVEQYMSPANTHMVSTPGSPTHSIEAFGDFTSHSGKDGIEGAMGATKHSMSIKNSGASTKPRSLVIGSFTEVELDIGALAAVDGCAALEAASTSMLPNTV